MKLRLLFFLNTMLALLPLTLSAQEGKLPPFRMMQPGNRIFRAEQLPAGKPILIIYFSTDCEVCHAFVDGILNRMQEFRSVSIAMVTYQTIDELTKYIVRKNLNMYPNIYAGTEGNVFFLRKYYGITTFPYVALYTKEGNLVYKDYGTRVTVDGVAKKIKGL